VGSEMCIRDRDINKIITKTLRSLAVTSVVVIGTSVLNAAEYNPTVPEIKELKEILIVLEKTNGTSKDGVISSVCGVGVDSSEVKELLSQIDLLGDNPLLTDQSFEKTFSKDDKTKSGLSKYVMSEKFRAELIANESFVKDAIYHIETSIVGVEKSESKENVERLAIELRDFFAQNAGKSDDFKTVFLTTLYKHQVEKTYSDKFVASYLTYLGYYEINCPLADRERQLSKVKANLQLKNWIYENKTGMEKSVNDITNQILKGESITSPELFKKLATEGKDFRAAYGMSAILMLGVEKELTTRAINGEIKAEFAKAVAVSMILDVEKMGDKNFKSREQLMEHFEAIMTRASIIGLLENGNIFSGERVREKISYVEKKYGFGGDAMQIIKTGLIQYANRIKSIDLADEVKVDKPVVDAELKTTKTQG